MTMQQPANRKSAAEVARSRREEPDDQDKEILPVTTLNLDVSGGNGRRTYAGKFRFKVPTMGDRIDIGALKAQYLQQLEGVDGSTDSLADALAYLNVTLDAKSVPDWWRDSNFGIDLYDYQPLLTLYAMARAYEATFLGGSDDAAGDEGEAEGGPDGDGDGDVGDDVQPPAQRRQVLATLGKGGDGPDPDGASG
jgi:hypothetical protein